MKDRTAKGIAILFSLITVLFLLIAGVGLALGMYWLLWSLWSWTLPQLWSTGPQAFIRPNFWLFAAAWCLATTLSKSVFGRSKS